MFLVIYLPMWQHFKVNTVHEMCLRPVGVVMCDVCVKDLCGFYCCCVFYSIRNCGKL